MKEPVTSLAVLQQCRHDSRVGFVRKGNLFFKGYYYVYVWHFYVVDIKNQFELFIKRVLRKVTELNMTLQEG